MAFYSYRDEYDFDRCYSPAYTTLYDYDHGPTPFQSSNVSGECSAYYTDNSFITPSELNYSVYTSSDPKLHYYPNEYHASYNYYKSSVNPSEITYLQPRFVQYEPPTHNRGYFPSETNFTISYSTVEFNEPEFEEYDSTPYGGGYDPIATYGKPLPPSDAICYPREVPQSDNTPLEYFPYSSIPSPYGKDDDLPTKPATRSKPADTKAVETEDKVAGDDGKDAATVGPGVIQSDGLENGQQNGLGRDYGYESERQAHQIPYGSGLESLDICESIFGYWPCLAKMEQQKRDKCNFCDQERRIDPWESAANYLFGSPVVYDYENYHHQNSWLQ